MQNTIILESNKLYILSGISASGKSTLTNQLLAQGLPEDAIVSTDSIRRNILGTNFFSDDNGIAETLIGWNTAQKEIFEIIDQILHIRLKQKLTTVLDATNLTDKVREHYVDIAHKHGVESQVIIFDVPVDILKQRLVKRNERFDISVIDKQYEIFQKTSKFPFVTFNSDTNFILTPKLLSTTKVDVLGDVHGMFSDLVELLKTNNWYFNGKYFENIDSERKLLFLGDIVDRGEESIEILQAVYHGVNAGTTYFILGNHEAKLISSYDQYISQGLVRGKSLSSAETFMELLKLPKEEQIQLIEFLRNSPISYCMHVDENKNITNSSDENVIKFAFNHADNIYYHPYKTPYSYALYGNKNHDGDNDAEYEKNYNLGLNKYIYFRGHIVETSKQNHIFSLEDKQAFNGNLVLISFDKYIDKLYNNKWLSTYDIFEDTIMKKKTEYNFDDKIKDKVTFLKELDKLQKEGLVSDGWKKDENGEKTPHPDGFKIYKYAKKVFFKRLWKTNPVFEKARGLVLDIAGNVVVHPFDKIYNYGEYDTGLDVDKDRSVHVVEKLNGFMGCISKHPFKNELLLSTTGSLTSPFIQYIRDFITPELETTLLNHFKNNQQTLMFEVIHPEDKHIIEYPVEKHGLWLIGARGLNFNDQPLSEIALDKLGEKLGFKRGFWYEAKFGDVLDKLQHSELEGFMIRDSKTDDTLMKIKTNYYLVTKFIGRLNSKLTNLMFSNPEKFKQDHVDEEFYPMVDLIVKDKKKEEFEVMDPKERVDYVRSIVNHIRDSFNHNEVDKVKPKI